MSRCRRCGDDTYIVGKRICSKCMKEFTDRRTLIYCALTQKWGPLTPENHPAFVKELKRLERIGKKNPDKLQQELSKLT